MTHCVDTFIRVHEAGFTEAMSHRIGYFQDTAVECTRHERRQALRRHAIIDGRAVLLSWSLPWRAHSFSTEPMICLRTHRVVHVFDCLHLR